MIQSISSIFGAGLDPKNLTILQIIARALLMFFGTLIMIRLGDRRFLSSKTPFDAVLGFIMASMLARSVNGSAPIIGTLTGGFVLILLHRGLAALASRSHFVGRLIKGDADLIIEDGVVIEDKLRSNSLSERDVLEDVRLNGKVADISEVRLAYVERNGNISVIPKS